MVFPLPAVPSTTVWPFGGKYKYLPLPSAPGLAKTAASSCDAPVQTIYNNAFWSCFIETIDRCECR